MLHDMLSQDLTPRRVVESLDRYIIGQQNAKRAVAIALRNRWRRQNVPPELRDEIMPKNIIMMGPTGVGKTEIARRIARLARAPFLKIEASKFTEVGYVGRDVESIVRDLVELSIEMVKREAYNRVYTRAREYAEEAILDQLEASIEPKRASLDPTPEEERKAFIVGHDGIVQREEHALSHREMILARLREGELNAEVVEIEVSSASPAMEGVRTAAAAQLGSVFESMFAPSATKRKRVRVAQAMESLMLQESNRLIDMDNITREALIRAEQSGIVFLDEIDKIARPSGQQTGANPDVSREGVQRDLLPIVEGTSVSTKYGSIKTDHILFIAAGAFHVSRPSDLIPELQGRFPIRVELNRLTEDDFTRILKEPKNSLCRQYIALMATEGVEVEFDEGAVEAIAHMAWRANESMQNIGARRLHTIMEKIFEDLSFHAPERSGSRSLITPEYVSERMDEILADDDLSHYIL